MKSAQNQLAAIMLMILLGSCDEPYLSKKMEPEPVIQKFFHFETYATAAECEFLCEPSDQYSSKALFRIYDVVGTYNLETEANLFLWHTETDEAQCTDVQGEIQLTIDDGNYLQGTYSGDGTRCEDQVKFDCAFTAGNSAGVFRTHQGTKLNLIIDGIFAEDNTEPQGYQVKIVGDLN